MLGPPRRGRRIAYVTDTRPCAASVRLAAGCDLLIHEATFDADRQDEAAAKGHSTVADATSVARSAGARALALTHISPRYEAIDALAARAKSLFTPAWIAEDGMEITLDREGEVVSVTGERRR